MQVHSRYCRDVAAVAPPCPRSSIHPDQTTCQSITHTSCHELGVLPPLPLQRSRTRPPAPSTCTYHHDLQHHSVLRRSVESAWLDLAPPWVIVLLVSCRRWRRRDGVRQDSSGGSFLFLAGGAEPVGGGAGVDDVGVEGEAIDDGGGQSWVGEGGSPFICNWLRLVWAEMPWLG